MIPIRAVRSGAPAFLAVALAACLLPAAALAQPVEEVLPEEVDGYTLEDVDRRGPAAAQAVYRPADGGRQVNVILAHGESADQVHGMLRSRMRYEAAEVEEVSVAGRTFRVLFLRSDLVVFDLSDGVLLGAGHEDLGEEDRPAGKAAVVDFLEAFGPDRLEGWTPPEPSEARTEPAPERSVQKCGDLECFREAAGACEPAVLGVSMGAVAGEYRVGPPEEGDACEVSYRFTRNPNPDYVGKQLRFPLSSGAELSEELLREVVKGCLAGREEAVEAHGCEGGLVGIAGGGR